LLVEVVVVGIRLAVAVLEVFSITEAKHLKHQAVQLYR
jgi:hypothetical protein